MPEEYEGVKFETIYIKKIIPLHPNIKKLIFWGKKFSLLDLTPAYDFGAAGNLSFRTDKGFIITGTGKDLGKLEEKDFVEVVECDESGKIKVIGKEEPSSEVLMHYFIYKERKDVDLIFHVHDDYAVKNYNEMGLKCTEKEESYGTLAFAKGVVKALEDGDYVVIKNHGVVSVGKGFDSVGERIIEINDEAKIKS